MVDRRRVVKITISGDIGSGKSSVGRYLADRLGAEFIDAGQLCRKYADDRGMTITELYQSNDNRVDIEVDNQISKMGREDKSRVYVSRTAWHLIPDALHIYMHINPMVAAQRILSRKSTAEEFETVNQVISDNERRVKGEDIRYKHMYGITREQQLNDTGIFMCVGNNDLDTVCRATEYIIGRGRLVCFDPRVIVPTRYIHDLNKHCINNSKKRMTGEVVYTDALVEMVNGVPYALTHHDDIVAACMSGVKFLYTNNFSLVNRPSRSLSIKEYHDWENYLRDIKIGA